MPPNDLQQNETVSDSFETTQETLNSIESIENTLKNIENVEGVLDQSYDRLVVYSDGEYDIEGRRIGDYGPENIPDAVKDIADFFDAQIHFYSDEVGALESGNIVSEAELDESIAEIERTLGRVRSASGAKGFSDIKYSHPHTDTLYLDLGEIDWKEYEEDLRPQDLPTVNRTGT